MINSGSSGPVERLSPIWHPAVHYEFGETLRFFGVELASYPKALRHLLNDPYTRASVYEVYGTKDLLIRSLGTVERHEQLERSIEGKLGRIASQFQASHTLVTWGVEVSATELERKQMRREIAKFPRSVLVQAGEDWMSIPDDIRRDLMNHGLVIGERPTTYVDGSHIRVFIFVGSLRTRMDASEEIINDMLEKVDVLRPFLFGLYYGIGGGFGGHILLELDVPVLDFTGIIRCIRDVHTSLALIHPRTQTFVAGDVTNEHVDQCEFYETAERSIQRYEESHASLRRLGFTDKLLVVDLLERWRALMDERTRSLFVEATIDALGSRDTTALRKQVTAFGNSTESSVGSWIASLARSRWGEDAWRDELPRAAGLEKDWNEWTLGECVSVLGRWKARIGPEVQQTLTAAAMTQLEDFVDLRNAAVHVRRKEGKRMWEDFETRQVLALVEGAATALRSMDIVEDTDDS